MAEEHEDPHEDRGEDRDRERRDDRRSGQRGTYPVEDERPRPVSELSAGEFARLARERLGMDPELPESEVPDAAGWTTGTTGPSDTGEAGGFDDGGGAGEPSGSASSTGATGAADHQSEGGGGSSEAAGLKLGNGPDRHVWHWENVQPRTGGFEPGVAQVVEALRALEDPSGLVDSALQERMVDLARLHSLVTSAVASHMELWDARCLWGSDRSKSPSSRLARDANCSSSTARSWVMSAREVSLLPATAEAWKDGRLSTDHVRRLVRAGGDGRLESFLRDEQKLIAMAVEHAGRFAAFERAVSVWEQHIDDEIHDPTDPDDLPKGEKRQRNGRSCSIHIDDDGAELKASLTKVGGVEVRTQLQRIVDELWRQDWDEAKARLGECVTPCNADLVRTNKQRWADALVEMAKRAGAWKVGDALPKPLIVVHVTAADMTGPIRETFNGIVLSRRDIADLISDEADWERVIYGPNGQPTDVTSLQRNFTGALRRAVQIRDRVCSHPTCDVDAERCQVDHIVEYSDGGLTNIENARLLCPKHNMQRPGRGKTPPRSGDDDPDDEARDDGGDCDCDCDCNCNCNCNCDCDRDVDFGSDFDFGSDIGID